MGRKKAKTIRNAQMMRGMNRSRSYQYKLRVLWEDRFSFLDGSDLTNQKGRIRSIEENKQILLVLKCFLKENE
jgi:hypothetical protein